MTVATKPRLLRHDPAYFAARLGGMYDKYSPTNHQNQLFDAIKKGHNRIAVRSSTGTGKTTAIAALGLWFLTTHQSCKVIYTSTKADQLRHQVWSEMAILKQRCHPAVQNGITIQATTVFRNDNPEGAVALAKVAPVGSPEKQQGWHHENMMIIIDESSGVDDKAIDALQGCCTNPNNILIMVGNPTRLTGRFYDAFHKMRSSWYCLHFSGPDSPIVGKQYLDNLAKQYGENSNIYRVRGLGEFPLSDDNSLILLEYIEAAAGRAADDTFAPIRIGVDPARSVDGDASGLIARSGNRVLAAEQFWVKDTIQVAGKAKVFKHKVLDAYPNHRFDGFYVDVIGLGAGTHDSLVNTGEQSTPVNVALPPTKKFREPGELMPANMRAQVWIDTMHWIRDDGGSLMGLRDTPELDIIMSELASPRYKENGNGQILLEPKDSMKKRGLQSPNLAEALCLTFAPKSTSDNWDEFYEDYYNV